MITEQDLHEYNKWLMEVWNPNQLYIPFGIDAPKAYLTYKTKVKNLDIPRVINWVAVTERMPEEEWGDYMVCLKNNAIFKANYSRIGAERWLIVGVGDTKDTNPVKYWAELPEPPCL